MKTLLIVEDEKMIRQGIKMMVQRSGVPVEVIIECNNGKMALEVLREQKVDVMFTDIRMPQMDGIELVKEMQQCDHIPITVAISGYDDFSYAVEMMRNGVREYILKPIEREKITDILRKLEEELASREVVEERRQKLGYQQMRRLMINEHITEEELETIKGQFGEFFYQGYYYVCCQNASKRGTEDTTYIWEEIEGQDVLIVSEEMLQVFLKEESQGRYVGVSGKHCGLEQLHEAYCEASVMRKQAFCKNQFSRSWGEDCEKVPEALQQEAARLLLPEAILQKVQLLGTERTEELVKSMNQWFWVAKKGYITTKQFEESLNQFLDEVKRTYRVLVNGEQEQLEHCRNIWKESCMDVYEEGFMDFVLSLHEKINRQYDNNRNIQRMRQAVAYVEEHYAQDLNMAVVSNYISMNYSLFSYTFKQYTGQNFVNYLKDIRMREAKKLLAETELKIIEISQKIGYDNEKHFMKMFKNTYGVSPSEYRKNMRRE